MNQYIPEYDQTPRPGSRTLLGRTYNTNSAELVCKLHSSPYGDTDWNVTHLYRTPQGGWFVKGRGGPGSIWSVSVVGGATSSGGGLAPVGVEAALSHARKAGVSEKRIAELFPQVDADYLREYRKMFEVSELLSEPRSAERVIESFQRELGRELTPAEIDGVWGAKFASIYRPARAYDWREPPAVEAAVK